jgi:hypothetical protein
MEAILRANGDQFFIAGAVLRESLYIHVVVDGVPEKEPVALDPFLDSGLLRVVEPEAEDEFRSLIAYAVRLDEGEAMTCALALHRGYRIATDEKKTIKLLGTSAAIVGTLDMVRAWEAATVSSREVMREVLAAIEDRGYVPGVTHPHYSWWRGLRHP